MPFEEIRIRPMERGDIAILAELEKECFGEPYTAAVWEQELANTLARTDVAVIAGDGLRTTPVGYINYWIVGEEGQLHRLAVKDAYRGRGIAGRLLRHLLQSLRRSGVATVQLEVRRSNIRAVKLYEKFGFQETGRRRGYYHDAGEDALLLTGAVGNCGVM